VQKLWNLILSGAVTGAIYSIMASGLVLTFQTSGIFNFAHGAVAFTTAFFYYQVHTGQGVPIVPAAILSVLVFAPLLGLALDFVLLRRLATAPVYARIVGTIGLLVALPAFALWLVESVGNSVLGLDLPKVSDTASVGGIAPGLGPQPPEILHISSGVNLSTDQLAVFIAAAISAFTLWFVIRRTRVGLQMRAVVDRESLASLRGVNPARTSRVAWILTMVLAGLGGVLIAPLFQLNDTLFTLVVLGSLFAVVVSGSLWGFRAALPVAFAGGLLLGVVQNLVAGYGDDILPSFLNKLSGFRSAIPFILVVIVLLVIGRDRGRAAGSVSDEAPLRDHRLGLSAWRRRLPWVLVTIALLAFSLQWIDVPWLQADAYEQSLIAAGIATGIVFLSFVVVTGLGGMVSLAQATFVVTGGFAAGWALNRDWGIDLPFVASHGQINFGLALIIGALAAAVLGAIVAIPVRHLGQVALAIMTFAIAFVLDLIAFDYEPIAKGSLGWTIRAPTLDIPGVNQVVDWIVPDSQDKLDLSNPAMQVVAFLALFGLFVLVLHSLQRSASGRAMLAVRSTEVAARTSGISPARAKTLVFALSAAIAGFGGVLLGVVNFSVGRTTAPPLIGLVWLAVAVTFGVRRPGGALIAGLSFVCTTTIFTWIGDDYLSGSFKDLTTSTQFTAMLFGLGAINLAKNPDGVLALIGHQRIERRVERERRARIAEAEAAAHGGEIPEHERTASTASLAAAGDAPAADARSASEAPGPEAALRLDGVVAGYGAVEVLHRVELDVEPGTIVALLGANGAGKSTLCAVASGLVAPTQGRILLQGEDVTALEPYERAQRGILLVPEARGIFPGLSVDENLRVLLRSDEEQARAFDRFPILRERRRQLAGLLSGGEQQMLSLAPALARPPQVLIADEPTLGLAPLAAEEVIRALSEIRDLGSSILLVEEKAREVMALADVVAFMELGQVVWVGPRDQADEERLAAAYLGGGPD
jgi:ABC-type branched-subunit amino acid transport system ATPase component/branched-subunit amino acid ABC-type transport system permease component